MALDPVHHKEIERFGLSVAKNCNDVGMRNPLHQADFLLESRRRLLINVTAWKKDFDRDRSFALHGEPAEYKSHAATGHVAFRLVFSILDREDEWRWETGPDAQYQDRLAATGAGNGVSQGGARVCEPQAGQVGPRSGGSGALLAGNTLKLGGADTEPDSGSQAYLLHCRVAHRDPVVGADAP